MPALGRGRGAGGGEPMGVTPCGHTLCISPVLRFPSLLGNPKSLPFLRCHSGSIRGADKEERGILRGAQVSSTVTGGVSHGRSSWEE